MMLMATGRHHHRGGREELTLSVNPCRPASDMFAIEFKSGLVLCEKVCVSIGGCDRDERSERRQVYMLSWKTTCEGTTEGDPCVICATPAVATLGHSSGQGPGAV